MSSNKANLTSSPRYIEYADLKITPPKPGLKSTDGVNGSITVDWSSDKVQLKPSAQDKEGIEAKAKARVKGGLLTGPVDYENLGEFFASHIAKALASSPDSRIVTPDVFLVGKKNPLSIKPEGISVASKYLDGFKDLGSKFGDPKPRYVRVNFNEVGDRRTEQKGKVSQGYLPLGGPEHAELKKAVAEGIALNMLIGNADINAKGNLGTVEDGKIGCIDFGHAFNSLINGRAAGGGVHDKNGILDFINRDKLLGGLTGGSSKLWRDYDGLIPSQEFADALKKMAAGKDQISGGMANAKATLQDFAKEFMTPNETELRKLKTEEYLNTPAGKRELATAQVADKPHTKMLIESLQRLNRNVGVLNVTGETVQDIIDQTAANLEGFSKTRCDQMTRVATLIELQADIDEKLKTSTNIEPQALGHKASPEMQKAYSTLLQTEFAEAKGGIRWAKTNAEEEPFVGNLDAYIEVRKEQLAKKQVVELQAAIDEMLNKDITSETFKLDEKMLDLFNRLLTSPLRHDGNNINWPRKGKKPFTGNIVEYTNMRKDQLLQKDQSLIRLSVKELSTSPQSNSLFLEVNEIRASVGTFVTPGNASNASKESRPRANALDAKNLQRPSSSV